MRYAIQHCAIFTVDRYLRRGMADEMLRALPGPLLCRLKREADSHGHRTSTASWWFRQTLFASAQLAP